MGDEYNPNPQGEEPGEDAGAERDASRYQYHSYYQERGDRENGYSGWKNTADESKPEKRRKHSAGKVIAVCALAVIFICCCIGISFLAVNIPESDMTPEPGTPAFGQPDGSPQTAETEEDREEPENGSAPAGTQASEKDGGNSLCGNSGAGRANGGDRCDGSCGSCHARMCVYHE